jgi:hypothetical protein
VRRVALAISFLGLVLGPIAAAAQEAAPPMPEDPRAPRYQEVERGFYTGFELGYLGLFKTPNADPGRYQYAPSNGGFSSGLLVGMTFGYDVSSRFALSAFVLGSNSQASVSYGAFSVYAAGADLRVALFGSRDKYALERTYIYVHGRAGYLLTRPEGLFGTNDTYFALGPGLEYYTRLRHFSVGLAADLAYVAKAGTAGVAVTPTVRYTF